MNQQTRETIRAAWTRKQQRRFWPLPQTSSSWLKYSPKRRRIRDCMAPQAPAPNALCPCTFKPWWVEQVPYKRCCHKRVRARRRLLARFLSERCEPGDGITLAQLAAAFEGWLVERGQAMPTRVWLSSDLAALGWRSDCTMPGRCSPRHIQGCQKERLAGVCLSE